MSYSHRIATCRLPLQCLRCRGFQHIARDYKRLCSPGHNRVGPGAGERHRSGHEAIPNWHHSRRGSGQRTQGAWGRSHGEAGKTEVSTVMLVQDVEPAKHSGITDCWALLHIEQDSSSPFVLIVGRQPASDPMVLEAGMLSGHRGAMEQPRTKHQCSQTAGYHPDLSKTQPPLARRSLEGNRPQIRWFWRQGCSAVPVVQQPPPLRRPRQQQGRTSVPEA